jgi:hypothetical protein
MSSQWARHSPAQQQAFWPNKAPNMCGGPRKRVNFVKITSTFLNGLIQHFIPDYPSNILTMLNEHPQNTELTHPKCLSLYRINTVNIFFKKKLYLLVDRQDPSLKLVERSCISWNGAVLKEGIVKTMARQFKSIY